MVKGGVHGKGGGVHSEGGPVWQRRWGWQRGVHAWPGGVHGRGSCVAGETATAVDGSHRTGMPSCIGMIFVNFAWCR